MHHNTTFENVSEGAGISAGLWGAELGGWGWGSKGVLSSTFVLSDLEPWDGTVQRMDPITIGAGGKKKKPFPGASSISLLL